MRDRVVWWSVDFLAEMARLLGHLAGSAGYLIFMWLVHPHQMRATVRENREMFARFDAMYAQWDADSERNQDKRRGDAKYAQWD